MKTFFLTLTTLLLFTGAFLITSCDGENVDEMVLTPIFDCPELELNIGEVCTYTVEQEGEIITITASVTEDCNCGDGLPEYDCPDLSLNFGDDCSTGTQAGTINEVCECEPTVTYDCPELARNVADDCILPNGEVGVVTPDCSCESPVIYDCPELSLNVGDDCSTGTTSGTVNENCACEPETYDCPDLALNIGDACSTPLVPNGIVGANCDCIAEAPDCAELSLNIGDVCTYTIEQGGETIIITSFVTEDCECGEDTVDCLALGLNVGDFCMTATIYGFVNDACECEAECPELGLNIGMDCPIGDGNYGSVTEDCNCEL